MSRQGRGPSSPLVVVLGSTGTGKSDLAVELARRFNGEVINADAMQLYKGLPVTTNKISTEEQQGIPHHLLGTIGLDEETWSVGHFKREATRIIGEIRSRGHLPIVAGGSQYYTDGLLFANHLVFDPTLDEAADSSADPVESEGPASGGNEQHPILDGPVEDMLAKLREVDPVMADRWHPKDGRKIRRSLEIYLTTGKRASDIYAEQKKNKQQKEASPSSWPCLLLWVYARKDALDARLDARIDTMIPRGLLQEACQMRDVLQAKRARGEAVDRFKGIWQSIGFKEVEPYVNALDARRDGEEEASAADGDDRLEALKASCLESMRSATRQYAKQQIRWIRNKTIPKLAEEGALDRLFVLDSTDKTQWQAHVVETAARLTRTFLGQGDDDNKDNGAPSVLPAPADVSETAREVLAAAMASAEKTVRSVADPFRQTCDVCRLTLTTEHQWKAHITGHRHRQAVKRQKLRSNPYYQEAKRLKGGAKQTEVSPGQEIPSALGPEA